MIICLSNKTVVVFGAVNGAIYDLKRNRIFSINKDSCDFLKRYIENKKINNNEEMLFLEQLQTKELIDIDYEYHKFIAPEKIKKQLNFVWLEVTQLCNLKCRHCYEGEVHKSLSNRLDTKKWLSVIKQLHDLKCPNIQFIGGEPTCFSDIIELLDFAGHLNFKNISYFTNATILQDKLLDCFIRNSIKINVSLYGHTAEIHDNITQINGSFEKTISNIKKLIAKGVSTTVSITIMKENEAYYENIIELITSLGVKHYKFDLVRGVEDCHQNCHAATRSDLIAYKYKTKPRFQINEEKFLNAFNINTCWFGKFAINENGDIIPCVFERNVVYGNVTKQSIEQILNSNDLDYFWTLDISKIDECKNCEFRLACKDCRPLGKNSGDLFAKNPRCLYNPLLGFWGKVE